MERSSQIRILIILILEVFLFATFSIAQADVVFAPPPPRVPPPGAGENFPESRFGTAPLQPDLGVRSIRAMEESQNHDLGRKPAGLEFADRTGTVKATPVIQDPGMPKSPTNLNPIPTSVARSGIQEVALIAGDLGFFPKTVFVTRDIPVRIFVTGASKKPLCIMMDSFQIRKQVRAQKIEEITFVPTIPGQYRFYCPINGMEGTLLVKELSSGNQSGAGAEVEPASRNLGLRE
jgi:hypothetical protein